MSRFTSLPRPRTSATPSPTSWGERVIISGLLADSSASPSSLLTPAPQRSRGGGGAKHRGRASTAFTLVELLVAILLVGICMAGVFGGLTVLAKTDARARDVVLLQRLAQQKISDVELVGDPALAAESGDFSEQGYPDATWSMTYEQEGDLTTLQRVTVIVDRLNQSQSLTTLVYVRPESTTNTDTTTGGTTP